MQQKKLQRSPNAVRARPQPTDEEHGLELNLDIGRHGSRVSKVHNSRKRSAERRDKLLSSRRTAKNGKTSVASGAAEAAGTHHEHERRSGAEGTYVCT